MLPIEECNQLVFPNKIMKTTDLLKMGFSRGFLMNAYHSKNQTFAWKMNVTKPNSPILFDTEGLKKYIQNQIKLEQQANRKLRLVV